MFILAEKLKAGLSQLDPFNKGKSTKDPLTNLKSITRWAEGLRSPAIGLRTVPWPSCQVRCPRAAWCP